MIMPQLIHPLMMIKITTHPGHCGVDVGLSEGTKVDLELLFKVIPVNKFK